MPREGIIVDDNEKVDLLIDRGSYRWNISGIEGKVIDERMECIL